MQSLHLQCISALCAARSFAYLYDMSALAVLLRLELHPHPGVLQRPRPDMANIRFLIMRLKGSNLLLKCRVYAHR
nr:hypothetical protein [Neisseria dumasiana]